MRTDASTSGRFQGKPARPQYGPTGVFGGCLEEVDRPANINHQPVGLIVYAAIWGNGPPTGTLSNNPAGDANTKLLILKGRFATAQM